MSDDPLSPRPAGSTPAGLYEHWCEHPGCTKWGGLGYTRNKVIHWFCGEHKDDGEALMAAFGRP